MKQDRLTLFLKYVFKSQLVNQVINTPIKSTRVRLYQPLSSLVWNLTRLDIKILFVFVF